MSTMKAMRKTRYLLTKASDYEMFFCTSFNAICRNSYIKEFFTIISRLGDGIFWYIIMLGIPIILGIESLNISLHMLTASIVAYLVYKLIKSNTKRPRPFSKNQDITLGGRVLDKYSFPSGHTLHAVNFTIILLSYFPQLAFVLIPFSTLVALSRVALGLHYPTDVICGTLLGTAIALFSCSIFLTV